MAPLHRDADRNVVAEVKAAVDIADLIGTYIELKPAGAGRFKACCPFHNEKTPSFFVNRDRQTYHCFGCGKGGDIFSFLEELDGLRFPEALKQLADRAGIALPERSQSAQADDDLRGRLLDLTKFAAQMYWRQFSDEQVGAPAREYLHRRNIPDALRKQFGIGFAPDAWQTLTDAAQEKGFQPETLLASGLVKDGREGRPYDLLRNRVIFPIRDLSGRVVAFGGRDLGDSPAKYMNSPESEVYRKSQTLYGLFEARDAIRKSGEALIVEGYFDVLRCFAAGVENVVATCGTALTAEQARLLRRFANRVVILFDGDAAGIRAALRSVGILVGAGLSVRAMVLPDGLDPDDFLQKHGPEAFRERLELAPGWIVFYTDWSRDRTVTVEGRTEVARELFEIVAMMDDSLRQDEYIRAVAQALNLSEYQCRREFAARTPRPQFSRAEKETDTPAAVNPHDREFIAILLHDAVLANRVAEALRDVPDSGDSVREVLAAIASRDPIAAIESAAGRALYTSAANAENTWGERGEAIVRDRLNGFRRAALLAERSRIEEAMRRADCSNNSEEFERLALARVELDKRIHQAGAA